MIFSKKRLIAGTATFGKLNSVTHIRRMIDEIVTHGIKAFDLAPLYGAGCMETIISNALSDHAEIDINTKFGIYTPLRYPMLLKYYLASKITQRVAGKLIRLQHEKMHSKELVAEAHKSLANSQRLFGSQIDIFFSHEVPIDYLECDEFLAFVQSSKEKGYFKRFGLGGYRRQYETHNYSPLWDYVDVVQVESFLGQAVQVPPTWQGEIYLHGILCTVNNKNSSSLIEKNQEINQLIEEAFNVQKADSLVVGFSRRETFLNFLHSGSWQ